MTQRSAGWIILQLFVLAQLSCDSEPSSDGATSQPSPAASSDRGNAANTSGAAAPSPASFGAGMLTQSPSTTPGRMKPDFPAGAVSKPGEYKGFGEKIYRGYELTSRYVRVRDGTQLAVDLYRPKDASGIVVESKLPVLFMHTPYNRRYSSGMELSGETYPGAAARLIEYGYVVAIADFRGVYASYGKNQGYNRGEWVDAARMDAYDIVEWLAMQPWATDKVGMWGCSATGGSQMQAATTAPPHLKAVFPMSCEFDAYPFGVPGGMFPAQGDTKATTGGSSAGMRDPAAVGVDADTGGSQLMAAVAEHSGGVENPGFVPYRDSVASKIPEQWWLKSSPHTYLQQLTDSGIAFYISSNWNEGPTKSGAFFTYKNLPSQSKLIVGPAEHCGWFTVATQTGFDIAVEERRFFDYWLKGIENGVPEEPKVYYYTYNEAADQLWRSAPDWPLPNEQRTKYYLGDKTLGANAPGDAPAQDETTVDYSSTAMNLKGLQYETEPLAAAVRVTGHPVAELWVSSSATDGDFVATLQDIAPDGTATSYNMHGRLRASLRKEAPAPYDNLGLPWHPMGSRDVQPLVANEPAQLRFDLLPISLVFKEGHRIRLVVTFAEPVTPRLEPAPMVRIHRDAAHPSSITLPIIYSR